MFRSFSLLGSFSSPLFFLSFSHSKKKKDARIPPLFSDQIAIKNPSFRRKTTVLDQIKKTTTTFTHKKKNKKNKTLFCMREGGDEREGGEGGDEREGEMREREIE